MILEMWPIMNVSQNNKANNYVFLGQTETEREYHGDIDGRKNYNKHKIWIIR